MADEFEVEKLLSEPSWGGSAELPAATSKGRFQDFVHRRRNILLAGLIITNIISIIALGVTLSQLHTHASHSSIYSPAEPYVEYIRHYPVDSVHETTPYMELKVNGQPSDEADRIWSNMYSDNMTTIIGPHEAAKLEHKTVLMPDSTDQYIIQLEVFHQLHCLDAIRMGIYGPEKYEKHPVMSGLWDVNGTTDYHSKSARHLSHCLDWIRQTLLCNAETTPIIWQFDPDRGHPTPQIPEQKMCTDWNILNGWLEEHRGADPNWQGFL